MWVQKRIWRMNGGWTGERKRLMDRCVDPKTRTTVCLHKRSSLNTISHHAPGVMDDLASDNPSPSQPLPPSNQQQSPSPSSSTPQSCGLCSYDTSICT
ncbi:hypothetical protein COCON_G00133350 [Conger conger]|uniref:Uncharacterized protein n=1 Tax=Conger conger TaxID=82655 RepID=A0A9Q1HVP8_CONCO|nr:hypothetical protein COCON_G00133350 [Conger conger]